MNRDSLVSSVCLLTSDASRVQTWGSLQDGSASPDVQSFLSSVDQFVSNLSSARVNMERKFQLQQVELPDAVSQLSCPADYTAAGRKVPPAPSSSTLHCSELWEPDN